MGDIDTDGDAYVNFAPPARCIKLKLQVSDSRDWCGHYGQNTFWHAVAANSQKLCWDQGTALIAKDG